MLPECELGILDELNESDEEAPRMRAVYNQALQKHTSDLHESSPYFSIIANQHCTNTVSYAYLFLNCFCVGLCEEIQQGAAEVMRMRVWVPAGRIASSSGIQKALLNS